MRVKVLVPFHSKATGKYQVENDIIELSDEQLDDVRKINVNMVVLEGVQEKPKANAKKQRKK